MRWSVTHAFAVLLILLGTLGVVVGVHLETRRSEVVSGLRESGTATTAVVYDRYRTSGKNSKERFALRYLSDGVRTAWVDCGWNLCPDIGEAVPIWVDPADPGRFVDEHDRLALGDPADRDGVLLIVVAGLFALIGGIGLFSLVVYGPRKRPPPEFFEAGSGDGRREERLKRTNRRRHRRR